MLQLPNNCRIGKISVSPSNWAEKSKVDIIRPWTITYRFYDDNKGVNKQIRRQGMNEFSTLGERQKITTAIINKEINDLKNGYNPILDRIIEIDILDASLPGPKTPFAKALKMAEKTMKLDGFTASDMSAIVSNVVEAAVKIYVDSECVADIPIYEIKKRHVRAIMNKLSLANNWSGHSWNKYRTHLMILFKELGEYDAVESNIPREISKRKTVKKARIILSESERIEIKKHLLAHNYRFWLFVNMFFHSGSRISEFYRLKIDDINFEKQTVKFTVKKGRQYVEAIKPIKNIALPFWKEYISGYEKNKNFELIGEGLFPAERNVRYDQINKRWNKIKNNLGIVADFYSLKHLNTDQVSEQLGIERAQKLNSHTSTATTKIYAINENAREMELIKRIANPF